MRARRVMESEKDPRERKLVGWATCVPLYQLKGLPKGVTAAAGTDYPTKRARYSVVIHAEFKAEMTPFENRRLLRQVFRGLAAHAEENKAWAAASRLGGHDAPANLPQSRPAWKEVHCFWMLLAEYSKPVLAFRLRYQEKELLKRLFNEAFTAADGAEVRVRSGWYKEAKVWWVSAEHDYTALLGRLRHEGFRLTWLQRDGFPPAPPVQGAA